MTTKHSFRKTESTIWHEDSWDEAEPGYWDDGNFYTFTLESDVLDKLDQIIEVCDEPVLVAMCEQVLADPNRYDSEQYHRALYIQENK
jgi:hypothetical protein